MAEKWKDLRAGMAPEARARAAARTEAMLVEMQLRELRRARGPVPEGVDSGEATERSEPQ